MTHKSYTPEEMAELERLEQEATDGEWRYASCSKGHGVLGPVGPRGSFRLAVTGFAEGYDQKNAAFIARARNEFPRLLALVKRHQEALENIQDWSEIEDAQQIAREALSGGEK